MKLFLKSFFKSSLQGLSRLSSYGPALIVMIIAAWSFWMTQTVEVMTKASRSSSVFNQGPDYEVEGFWARSFDAQGHLISLVKGKKAVHDPVSQRLKVEQAQIEAYQAEQTTRAQAQWLWVDDHRQYYELQKDVELTRQGPDKTITQFEGQRVLIDSQAQVIESLEPIRMTRGADVITANSLRYDQATSTIWMKGNVKATFAPR